MKKIILFTFLFFISLAAFAQSAQSTSDVPSFRSTKVLKIFPNPATEFFMLNDLNEQVAEINIYNIVGRKMKTIQVTAGKKYYLDNFPKGMYLLQLVGHDTKIIATHRLNVKKP
ncbi:MAG: T9SS type A sorting domain-containing protein [Bacteroidota bacterium]